MDKVSDLRIYDPRECAVFCKVKERFGECSNMCGGFILLVNGISIRTSEALFQALRFTGYPHVQRKIIEQKSPMMAKLVGKPYRKMCNRPDWDEVNIKIMRWCLRVKLLHNFERFSHVLLETGDMPIVELSTKSDDFWGTLLVGADEILGMKIKKKQTRYEVSDMIPAGSLVGYNVMGRLNMELREALKKGVDQMSHDFTRLEPLDIPDFLLFGESIKEILRK
ncbi:MAG TPA: NADAR family protein [Patescibacteria group bacterium]